MNEQLGLPPYEKDKWSHGEWDNEPDRVDFIHSGYSCFILRNYSGNWCGYVGVPRTHPYYEKSYDEVPVDVHGGLTYSSHCSGFICHTPKEGMPDDVWWLGFDTADSGDLTPAYSRQFPSLKETYKNIDYVTKEVKQLAEQLKELER